VPTKRPVVAVIDDDPSVLKATGRLLSIQGFDTELYGSSGKFLDAVTTTQAFCLIVDVQLGEICGVEFVRRLKDLGIAFPVIFMTGNADEKVRKRALETGCVAFFIKPFSAYLLIEALYTLPGAVPGGGSA
jgi:FixJ family two-component response regulator